MVFRFVARMEFQLLDANFLILNGILFRKDNTVCYRTDVRFRALHTWKLCFWCDTISHNYMYLQGLLTKCPNIASALSMYLHHQSFDFSKYGFHGPVGRWRWSSLYQLSYLGQESDPLRPGRRWEKFCLWIWC